MNEKDYVISSNALERHREIVSELSDYLMYRGLIGAKRRNSTNAKGQVRIDSEDIEAAAFCLPLARFCPSTVTIGYGRRH